MLRFPALTILLALAATACSSPGPGSGPNEVSPATSIALPTTAASEEIDSPNSFPPGFSPQGTAAPDAGVVGVAHLPP